MDLRKDALEILKETSRTFYIPIRRLPLGLQEAVASAYLCMRAIDEIEDHPELDNHTKAKLLQSVSLTFQAAVDGFAIDDFSAALNGSHPLQNGLIQPLREIDSSSADGGLGDGVKKDLHSFPISSTSRGSDHQSQRVPLTPPSPHLPISPSFVDAPLAEVTTRVGEWAVLAPVTIAPRIWDATAAMADRMAYWANNNWEIHTEADLDRYTFGVAGAVGLILSDLWSWYDGTQTNRVHAIGFGRGLQAVNILRNRNEDLARGVDFFPDGWSEDDMQRYARRNLVLADAYIKSLPTGPALDFCQIILTLGHATLDTLARGEHKLSRSAVLALIEQVTGIAK